MLSVTSDSQLQIDTRSEVHAVAFTANGEYLVSGGVEGVLVWQVNDGKRVATLQVDDGRREAKTPVERVAVSKDGEWIAAGSANKVLVWNMTTCKQVFAGKSRWPTEDIDFSPDSSRLVSADGFNGTATIWDFNPVDPDHPLSRTLDHGQWVRGAKYSPEGDRIATSTSHFVRVWARDGTSLVNTDVGVGWFLGWFSDHLLVKTNDSKIKKIDASTGSALSEWSVPGSEPDSRIIMPQHGKFIVHASTKSITFWSTSTHTQIGVIPHSHNTCSIALSPNDQLLAITTQKGEITTKNLSLVGDLDISIDRAVLDSWNSNQLANVEASLTAAIPVSGNTVHHVLASRALVRARLQQWDAALADSEESIKTQPSVMGYVAKCVALIGMGEIRKGCRVCDAAVSHSDHVTLLLLIKAVVLFMAGEHDDGISRINDLVPAAYSDSTLRAVQAYLHMESGNHTDAIQSFENARMKLGSRAFPPPLIVSLISGWKFGDLAIRIQQQSCEALFAAGRSIEAGESALRMMDREINITEPIKAWVSDFMHRCLSTPENHGSASSVLAHPDGATMPQEMSRATRSLTQLSREWARLRLTTSSWKDALTAATGFILPRFIIYQDICELLVTTGHVVDAVACFHDMRNEQAQEISDQADWSQGFKSRCCGKLEDLGDTSMDANQYDEAISWYATALSLEPATPQDLLVKRSKAHAGKGEWEDALNDANEAIELCPSSPFGHERKYEALHGAGRYGDAIDAFESMLSKMSESSDPEIRGEERSLRYVRPGKIRETIRKIIKATIRDSPVVLINAISGRLCDKTEQAAAFESAPVFTKLISSMTTHINLDHIREVVAKFYRYTTLSHTWEDREPLFAKVTQILVYDLEMSPTHDKLQMFCKIIREAGFYWAWSDTCCINKADHSVLQEALVSMFKWYGGSAMTIIFLRGVGRRAQHGAMMRSIWNTRGWTLQEFHASKVVQFYTEEWTPYLGLDIPNHKDAPEIVSEMGEATGISAQALTALRPGLYDIREKLRLASTRQTTRVEDEAYSLLGIFSLSLPAMYGEGDKALGRLLAQLLTNSGDTSILAWTGTSGSFNSCLPNGIDVFAQPPASHIPLAIPDAEMPTITVGLHCISVARLYNRLKDLPMPSCSGCRIKLPCLTFKLGRVSTTQNGSELVFRAQTNGLGIVEITTEEDLSRLDSLYLVHPWIDFLLDRQPIGVMTEPLSSNTAAITWRTHLIDYLGRTRVGRSIGANTTLPPPSSTISPKERRARNLKFVARLQKPFGALLLTPTRRNAEEYRRGHEESYHSRNKGYYAGDLGQANTRCADVRRSLIVLRDFLCSVSPLCDFPALKHL